MEKKTFAIAALTLFVAAGCSDVRPEPGPGFGDATAHNMALEIVDPKPDLTGKEIPDLSGRRDALAIDRYETGKTLKPLALRTTTGVISGGGAMETQP